MKEFNYTIKDELGIHARPAGLLVKEAGQYNSSIVIQKGEKSADAKRLFALMSLAVKKDDQVTVRIEGDDEAAAYEAISKFFENNL
jgi:phosphocarrier protein HPr